MASKTNRGFTIIEVMLFLGVTGVLVIGILAGSGVAIGHQRYRDSVNSFKFLVQHQYDQANNVSNDRDGDQACNSNATVTQLPAGNAGTEPRGTSDCVLLGRVMTVGADGKTLTTASVLGYRTSATAPVEPTDIDELVKNYKFGLATLGQETSQVEWNARIVNPKTSTAQPLTLLVVRSPVSGSILTFVHQGAPTDLATMVSDGITSSRTEICVVADAGTYVGKPLAVRIDPFASNQSAVLIPSEGENVCA